MMTRRMEVLRVIIVSLILLAGMVHAAPFAEKIRFVQPDGTAIDLWGQGDEFYADFETLDGYTVVFNPATKAYDYAKVTADGNDLEPTGQQVGKIDPQTLGVPKHLRIRSAARQQKANEQFRLWDEGMEVTKRWTATKAAWRAAEAAAEAKGGPVMRPPSVTTRGTKVGLTLLIDFQNDPATIPQAEIVNFCNADSYTHYGNNGSIKKYFRDNSKNLLTYSNVVTIYIRIPNSKHPKSWYNNITKDNGTNANYLIRDAIAIMRAMPGYTNAILPKFNKLTVDSANRIVACNVFYAGGNGGVWDKGLWPHSWSLWVVGAQSLSPTKKVWRYQISNIGGSLDIGTFCHENGHMLCGFPDICDYGKDSKGGAGAFCLMNSGNYAHNPAQFCAYLKRAAGWATVVNLTSASSITGTLVSANSSPLFNRFYRYQKPGVPTEYFLLENRQKTGRDANLPASGIAIWHIDELGNRDNQSRIPNATHANYEVSLEQADNRFHFQRNINAGDANDLYRRGNSSAGYSNQFSDTSAPNSRWWNGALSGANFHDFSASSVSMTFQFGIINMVLIPAGSFQMGDSFSEGNWDERPVHSVYVSAFYMDRYEVTKTLWDQVASWAATHGYDISAGSGSGKAANHPVYFVSWYECVKWCNARSEKAGLTPCYYTSSARTTVYRTGATIIPIAAVNWNANGYRLPTEAEWEKAARGGVANHRFPWSNADTIQHARANYYSYVSLSYDTSPTRGFHPTFATGGYPYTSPVGYFAANGYGLYDMAGNVWEWCWDWYSSSYYGSSPGADPRGASSGSFRVLRGGGWLHFAVNSRVALRYVYYPYVENYNLGFRCVRGL